LVEIADVDALYGLPLEQFTSARDRLARELRQGGDREGAKALGALRKPVLAAWVVNQLARTRGRDVDLLLDAGNRLLEEQRSGKPGSRSAYEHQRRALDSLLVGAREILGGRSSEQTLRTVAETLRTASLTEDGRELLARGRLTEPLTTTGWDIVAANPPPPGRRAGAKRSRDTEAREQAQEELLAATAVRDDARRRLREAEDAERSARRSFEHATKAVEQARLQLERADEALRAVKRSAGRH
jgi:hypothetical protein